MPYALIRATDGTLVSLNAESPPPLDGCVVVEVPAPGDGESWDPEGRTWRVLTRTVSVISRQDFLDRVGLDTLVAVQMAAQGTTVEAAALRAWLLRFQVVSEIDVADARTVAGVDALIASGLLPAERRAAVLAVTDVPVIGA